MVNWMLACSNDVVKEMICRMLDLLDRRFKVTDALPGLPCVPFFILQNNVVLDKTFRDAKKHARNTGYKIPRWLNEDFKKGWEIPVFLPFFNVDDDGNVLFEFFIIRVKTTYERNENVTYIRGFQNLIAAMIMFLSDFDVETGIKNDKEAWEASEEIIGQFMIENRDARHGGMEKLTEKQSSIHQ